MLILSVHGQILEMATTFSYKRNWSHKIKSAYLSCLPGTTHKIASARARRGPFLVIDMRVTVRRSLFPPIPGAMGKLLLRTSPKSQSLLIKSGNAHLTIHFDFSTPGVVGLSSGSNAPLAVVFSLSNLSTRPLLCRYLCKMLFAQCYWTMYGGAKL